MAEMFLQASVLNTTDTTIYLVCMQLHFFRILPKYLSFAGEDIADE